MNTKTSNVVKFPFSRTLQGRILKEAWRTYKQEGIAATVSFLRHALYHIEPFTQEDLEVCLSAIKHNIAAQHNKRDN